MEYSWLRDFILLQSLEDTRRTPYRRRPRRTFSRGFSSCHFTWARQSYMVHHRACGDLTEIQIAIWSPDETQYCSVRSWQTLHILMLLKLHYRLRARRQSEERYLPLPLPLPLCASSRSRMQRWEGNPRIFVLASAQELSSPKSSGRGPARQRRLYLDA